MASVGRSVCSGVLAEGFCVVGNGKLDVESAINVLKRSSKRLLGMTRWWKGNSLVNGSLLVVS